MDKICIIKQDAGIGDVFFTLKIAQTYINEGYKVIWPVLPQLLYLNDYITIEGLQFVNVKENFEKKSLYYTDYFFKSDDTVILPLQTADRIYPGCVIRAKYQLVNIDWKDWTNYLKFNRNYSKEGKLFKQLGLEGKEYAFVNRLYGTPPNFAVKDFKVDTELEIVESKLLDEFTVFDWCKVISNAKEIYTVDTSIMHLIEKIKIKSTKNLVWGRSGHYMYVDGLFKTNWQYQ